MTASSITLFTDLDLSASVLQALEESGYTTPTPIQAQMIPALLSGADVLGQAQTGTGKTAAFALPILERIVIDKKTPQALILTPTRELAMQVCEAFKKYSKHIKGLKAIPLYGGSDYGVQLRALDRGAHVVVGTPGRVMDHIKRETLQMSGIKCLVLDEADEMLRMGFKEDVEWILEHTPEQRQIAMFSATIPEEIKSITGRFLNNPIEISIIEKTATVENTRQRYLIAAGLEKKTDALALVLESEPYDAILIFARTKMDTVEIAENMQARGYGAAPLNGDIPQIQRERIIEQVKSGKLNIIIATDVAARGLDVERISHVVNFDAPFDPETYVHRIGRTGRAGRSGEAILFLSPREKRILQLIEKTTRQPIEPMQLPSAAAINKKRVAVFKQNIKNAMTSDKFAFFKNLLEDFCREHDIDALSAAAATACILQGDRQLLLPEEKGRSKKSQEFSRSKADNFESRPKPRRELDEDANEVGMRRYRIEVGKSHGVLPGHIVGAIAGETGISSRHIGKIKLFNDFSTVDLPEDFPEQMIEKLKTAVICQKQMQISLDTGSRPARKRDKPEPEQQPAKAPAKKKFITGKAMRKEKKGKEIKVKEKIREKGAGKKPPKRRR